MARAKPDDQEAEPLTAQVNVRMTPTELGELDELRGLAPRSIIAREALKIGLAILQAEPERMKAIRPHKRAPRRSASDSE